MRPDIRFAIREIRPADKAALREAHNRLSDDAVYRRFLAPKPDLSRAELRYLTEVDGIDHFALVAAPLDDPDRIVAVARFVRLVEEPDTAEFAIVVGDQFQGRGLGRRLGLMLADAARKRGVEHFTASLLGDNVAAHRLLDSISERMTRDRTELGVTELVLDLAA